MNAINFKRVVSGNIDKIISGLTDVLKEEGFGILTRIDLHSKIKEKLDKNISPMIILGACNPELAYEALQVNTDVASLLPCNAVIREIGPNRYSVELVRPSFMMEMFANDQLNRLAESADARLHRALYALEEDERASFDPRDTEASDIWPPPS